MDSAVLLGCLTIWPFVLYLLALAFVVYRESKVQDGNSKVSEAESRAEDVCSDAAARHVAS